jgi:predicted aldo/keto reductase-like oxidoreductase
MKDALSYLTASDEEKDYSSVISSCGLSLKGSRMYCNHCLPCASGIDIAAVTRLADNAVRGAAGLLKGRYEALEHKASECVQCGGCMKRCPFGVDVISNMGRAAKLFEQE